MTRLVLLHEDSYSLSIGTIRGVDLSDFDADDYISVSTPAFPISGINLDDTIIQFTSAEDAKFSDGPVVSIPFSSSTSLSPTPVNGDDHELRFPLSLLWPLRVVLPRKSGDAADLIRYRLSVTGVRFRVTATTTVDFKVMAIKCISKDWKFASVDLDTIREVVKRPVSPTGDPDYPAEFPVGHGWPVLWRDMNPKDFSVSFDIWTGEMEDSNEFSLYFRSKETNPLVMADLLAGDPINPFEGIPYTGPGGMDGMDMSSGPPGGESEYWLRAKLTWGAAGAKATLSDPHEDFYEFDGIPLVKDSFYSAHLSVNGNSITLHLLELVLGYTKGRMVFDSGRIYNSKFQRVIGRFGWHTELEDGSSYIHNIRHRSANFGEIRTRKFLSTTPVAGAQLVESSTPPKELLKGFGTGPWGGDVKSATENTFEVDTEGMMKGVQSNAFTITDWRHTKVEFEIRMPTCPIEAFFMSVQGGRAISIPMDDGVPGEWQKVHYHLPNLNEQTGGYRLVILSVCSPKKATWRVRDLSVTSRSVNWSARGQSDPWGMAGDQWVSFGDMANRGGGVVLKEYGDLQVQGELLVNDARISEFKTIPKYAELGRFIWDQQPSLEPPNFDVRITSDVSSENSLMVDFGATVELFGASLDDNEEDVRRPVHFHWYFEDGPMVGRAVRKVFERAGTHTVGLRVVYSDGTTFSPDPWVKALTA